MNTAVYITICICVTIILLMLISEIFKFAMVVHTKNSLRRTSKDLSDTIRQIKDKR